MSVSIRNAASLSHALAHHARELAPMVGVLAIGILTELEPRGWELRQSGVGPNSFSIRKDEHEYHFRTIGKLDTIYVRDAWFNGSVVARLASRVDALHFIERLVTES